MNQQQVDAILAVISPKTHDRFLKFCRIATQALESGVIANPMYQDLKYTFNNVMENAYRALHTEGHKVHNGSMTQAEISQFFAVVHQYPTAHTLNSAIKKVTAVQTDLPIKAEALVLLDKLSPLADAVNTLKDKAVKRQPKPVEDVKAKYDAPQAAKSAIGLVKAALKSITEAAREELVKGYVEQSNSVIATFTAEQNKANAEGNAVSPSDVFSFEFQGIRRYDGAAALLIEQTHDKVRCNGLKPIHGRSIQYVRKASADEMILAAAVKQAAAVQEAFVYKNLAKLDSIVDRKGGTPEITIISREVSLAGLTGTLRIAFPDKSAFTVQNAVVTSYSVHGNAFQRYPLTFHDVVMADGSKMGRPSEERVNTVFVGKA